MTIGPDSNPTQGFRPSNQQLTGQWNSEEEDYWRTNWHLRPYASADRGYDFYQPGFRFGTESATRYHGREWHDAEHDLRTDWDRYEHRGSSQWEHVKDAARDAWDRVRGRK